MCKETRLFFETEIDKLTPDEARRRLQELSELRPYLLSECKGISIARAVKTSLSIGQSLRRPILLSSSDHEPSPWAVTQAFLESFDVDTLDQLPHSPFLAGLGASALLEDVRRPEERTAEEAGYSPEHFALPGVRVSFLP